MRYNFACVLATYLKDYDTALELLGTVFEGISKSLFRNTFIDPDLDGLRGLPRFHELLAATANRLEMAEELEAARSMAFAPPQETVSVNPAAT